MPDPAMQQRLAEMVSGYVRTQAIYVAAELRLADRLQDRPRTATELAAQCDADPRALYRLMRALAALEIFAEDDQGRFGLTPLAECLLSDGEGSNHSFVILSGQHFPVWGELLHSVRTGKPSYEKVYGKPIFEHLADEPERAGVFDAAMTGFHGHETKATLDAFSLDGVSSLVDIGGGIGRNLAETLARYPAMRGTLFDLPYVVDRARATLEAAGLANRCEVVAGDFFERVPEGRDVYFMRHIIHDWDDDKAVRILRSCRAAMSESSRLLVVECVIPPGNGAHPGKMMDLAMLVTPGGMERTADEFERLFAAADLELTRIVPTASLVSVIEARAV